MTIQSIWRVLICAVGAAVIAACETPTEPVETDPPPSEITPPPEATFNAPPAGQFCVVNHMNAPITVAEIQIKGLNPLFQERLDAVSVSGNNVVPVRKCMRYAALDQRDNIKAGEVVWLNISWGSFEMGGPDPKGQFGQNAFKYAVLCGKIDVTSDGVIEVKYNGDLGSGADPDPNRVSCTRYNHDGSLRTGEYRPKPAKWEGRPRCPERYPKSGKWNKAFMHGTTGECYRCPAGYGRTVWDIHGSTACEKGGVLGIGAQHAKINYAGPQCGKPGSGRTNFRNGIADQCYSCPAGWDKPGFGTVSFDLTKGDACTPPDWPY